MERLRPAVQLQLSGGANQAFSSAPSPTFILSDVLVDGASVGRANSYTFNAVTANHTIAASFNGGWLAPTASANVVIVPNPNNAFTSDNTYATFSSLGERVDYTTFGIPAIPAGSTINGIEVAVEGYCTTVTRNAEIQLSWNGGTTFTTMTPPEPQVCWQLILLLYLAVLPIHGAEHGQILSSQMPILELEAEKYRWRNLSGVYRPASS